MEEKNMETDKPFCLQIDATSQQMEGYKSDNNSSSTTSSGNSGAGSGSDSGISIGSVNNNNNEVRNGHRIFGRENRALHNGPRALPLRAMDDGVIGMSSGGSSTDASRDNDEGLRRSSRACPSPISSIVGNALNQMHLKRSSSAPMINQLGIGNGREISAPSPTSTPMSGLVNNSLGSQKETVGDIDASALASSFLSSLGGPRPRRFSASFSPGSPGPAPNRVSQLRHENTADWETMSEKEFHGTQNITQSWEDLSLDSMSMEVGTRRPSISDQLWLSMPASSAPSSPRNMSPAASPRVLSRFSPSLSSPSPTRKSFTTRRSLSPIAVRPSVLAIGHGVKRKCDWDSNSSNQMDCSPQPAKRHGGLLGFNAGSPVSQFVPGGASAGAPGPGPSPYGFTYTHTGAIQQPFFPQQGASPFNPNSSTSSSSLMSMITNHVEADSPFSNETESSISSIGGCDSPFFRPVDSPLAAVPAEDSPHPPPVLPK